MPDPLKVEQLPCSLFGKKCIEVNTPERQCDWFVSIIRPRPQIAGAVAVRCLDAYRPQAGHVEIKK